MLELHCDRTQHRQMRPVLVGARLRSPMLPRPSLQSGLALPASGSSRLDAARLPSAAPRRRMSTLSSAPGATGRTGPQRAGGERQLPTAPRADHGALLCEVHSGSLLTVRSLFCLGTSAISLNAANMGSATTSRSWLRPGATPLAVGGFRHGSECLARPGSPPPMIGDSPGLIPALPRARLRAGTWSCQHQAI